MKIRDLTVLPLLAAPFVAFVGESVAIAAPIAQTENSRTVRVLPSTDETLYFNPDETYDLPVVIDAPTTVNGLTLPAGTILNGQLEPVEGGLRYVATSIAAGGLRNSLRAESDVLHDVKDPRETGLGAIAGDAAIGAAGGAVLGAIFGGGISIGEVVGGAAAGAVVGNVTAQRVVILEPNTPIALQIQ